MSEPKYPATMLVHWPTGPVACCDDHGGQLIHLGNFLGSHIVATVLAAPAECVNCLNRRPARPRGWRGIHPAMNEQAHAATERGSYYARDTLAGSTDE